MWLDRRTLCCCFCCTWMPRVRRRIVEDGTAECMDQGARTEEDVVNSPLVQGRVDKKCIHRPRKLAREMDKSDAHPKRKSESVDNILDRLDGEKGRSGVRVIYSDTETSDVEDLKNKAEVSKSSESLVVQSSSEYKILKKTFELPPKRPPNVKAKHVPQSDAVEMNADEGIRGKYSPRSNGDDGKTERVSGNVNDNKKSSERGTQGEIQEGKMKHRRFLTSLVMKDPKDGGQKSEKSDKKSKEAAKQRLTDHSGIDEAGRHRNELEGLLESRMSKSNAGVPKSAKKGDHESKDGTKMAKSGGKGKKKQGESHDKGTQRAETEESDPKRRRSRIGFLTKMLKKGGGKKAADGDTSSKADDEAAVEDDGSETPPRDPVPSATHPSESEEHSGDAKVPDKSHKVNFGLKLFPGDNDEEFKKKLESRMARIESEMNGIAATQKVETVDGKPPALPRPKINQISSMEASLPKMATDDDDLSAGPPLLPPRLIKLTPPSPPISDTTSPKSCDGPSGLLGKGILSYTSPNGFPSPRHSLNTVSEAINEEEIAMSQRDFLENGSQSPTLYSPILTSPSNAFSTRPASVESDENSYAANKIRDSGLNMGFDLGCLDGSDSRQTYETRETFPMNSQDYKRASRESDSYLQPVLPGEKETFQRSGIDELSLLLNELDRMNSSLLKQEDIGSNRRPMSEEIKRVSSYEEDFVNAFPIRRRRNSDPDYDIPRPHRIPSLQATKEEDSVDNTPQRVQREDSSTSSRENTDSIVIEATRFFGPGMDFSFDEQKYSCLKDGGDLWGFQCENKYLIADCIASPPPSESNEEPRNDNHPLTNENVCIETSESNVNENNSSQVNISELHMNEMQGDSSHLEPSVEHGDNCILRLGNELQRTVGTETRDVTLRNSNIDRACRKERSREVYENDLRHQLELNTLMEGISISRPLSAEDLLLVEESEENSVKETAVEGDFSQVHHDETVGNPGQVLEIWPEIIDADAKMVEEPDMETMSTIPEIRADSGEIIPPNSHMSSAVDVMDEEFCAEGESDLTVTMRPKDSSDENKSFRLSFATTETLLVEEEVLVATLKTITTTTTCLASATDGSQAVQNVEESVEEVTLDVDQLSDDQFDSFQVQSCVQT